MASRRTLSTADARRADVVVAAMSAFARAGYFGANTTEIAHAAGISQAYLYRLYDNKESLFVAVLGAVTESIGQRLAALDVEHGGLDVDELLGRSAERPADDEDAVSVLLHAAAAAHIPTIAAAVRDCYRAQRDRLADLGASDEQIRSYFAWSQYLNVLRAAGLPDRDGDDRLVPALVRGRPGSD